MKPNITKACIILLSAFVTLNADSKDPIPVRGITLVFADTVVKTSVWNAAVIRDIQPDCNYFWFYNNTICHNLGGYSGKLLHGKYEVFDKTKRMLCSGNFEHGLREGEWITWYNNGQIKDYLSYRKGKIHGIRKTYDSSGNLLSEIKYRNNLREGISYYYQADTIITVKYMNGVEVESERKKFHFLSILKRDQEKKNKSEGISKKTNNDDQK